LDPDPIQGIVSLHNAKMASSIVADLLSLYDGSGCFLLRFQT